MQISNLFLKFLVIGFIWSISSSFINTNCIELDEQENDLQAIQFNTDGLYYAEFYDYIFRGHFEQVEMTREDMQFLMIFGQYLRAYGRQCSNALPDNKVEIMEQTCATEEVTKNGYGDVISTTCIKYVWVGSGLYARPDLYDAKMEVEGIQRSEAIGTMMQMIADPNSMGNSVDMMHKAKGLKNDMVQIFKQNDCSSPGIRRFEENLKLFALNKAGIRMKETSKYTAMKTSGGPIGSQNLNKLVDDLVGDQAKTWGFNRYTSGSISGVSVLSNDSEGRPKELQANYMFSGFSGNSKGSVRISFTDGLPKCIYFYDFPQNCKTPNSSILSSYAQGSYAE